VGSIAVGAARWTVTAALDQGHGPRVYHAFITTAPAAYHAPSTLTLHSASLNDVAGLAADPVRLELARRQRSGRLVLVETTHFVWQRARYREGRHLFTPADPLLVGLNTLQHWLWHRIGLPPADRPRAHA
jgi:hypothetical protein